MKLLPVVVGMTASVSALDSLMAFECDGSMHLFPNAEAAMGAQLGSVPLAAITTLNAAVKGSIRAACPDFTDFQIDTLFGLNAGNVIRAFDPVTNDLDDDAKMWPAGCPNIKERLGGFNWQLLRQVKFDVPTSCSAATWKNAGKCQMKWELIDDVDIEIKIAKCSGSDLPSMDVRCNGAGCTDMFRPCSINADCNSGHTCDSLDVSFADLTTGFIDMGLLGAAETGACTDGVYDFGAQLLSKIMNGAAVIMDLAPTAGTGLYNSLSMCGIQRIADKYAATPNPTMAPTIFTGTFDVYVVAEALFDPGCVSDPITDVMSCRDLQASTYTHPDDIKPTLKHVTATALSKPLLWSDCDGNYQMLNNEALGTFNARAPIVDLMKIVEGALESLETCRTDGAGAFAADSATMLSYFYPWSINFWGNVLFKTADTAGKLNNYNPAALLDGSLAYYSAVQVGWDDCDSYLYDNNCTVKPAPYENIRGMPASCDGTTLEAGKCDMEMSLNRMLEGMGEDQAKIRIRFETCANQGMPAAFMDCEGPGCVWLTRPVGGACSTASDCGAGYICQKIEDDTAGNMMFDEYWAEANSVVNPPAQPFVSNFLRFLGGQKNFLTYNTNVCIVNSTKLGENIGSWAETLYQEINGQPTMTGMNAITGPTVAIPTGSDCADSGCPTLIKDVTPSAAASVSALTGGVVAMAVALM